MGGEEVAGHRSRSSPWPVFVALGLVLSEGGVLFGSPVVSVGGLLLLAGSAVGVVRESGFADSWWRSAAAFAGLYVAAGGLLVWLTTATGRGSYVLAAGVVVGVAAVALWLVETGRL